MLLKGKLSSAKLDRNVTEFYLIYLFCSKMCIEYTTVHTKQVSIHTQIAYNSNAQFISQHESQVFPGTVSTLLQCITSLGFHTTIMCKKDVIKSWELAQKFTSHTLMHVPRTHTHRPLQSIQPPVWSPDDTCSLCPSELRPILQQKHITCTPAFTLL